jgi:SM-20-related protein
MSGDTPIRLSAHHDLAALAQTFRDNGRIHIPSIFEPVSAQRILTALTAETPWSQTFNLGKETVNLSQAQLATISDAQRNAALARVIQDAGVGFQFLYNNYRIDHEANLHENPNHYLNTLLTFLNGEAFLGFARAVTGLDEIAEADAQATAYRPGHFLTTHDDKHDNGKRLAAYVLNFTPQWRPDWGGILQFVGEDGHLTGGYTPTFNALNMFRVPQPHAVSIVARYARGVRYSITGWLKRA